MNKKKKLACARKVFDEEIETLTHLRNSLGDNFLAIENEVTLCKGKIVLCGMGKSGHIARKISATMASLGAPSFFLHPAEALHGDLGMVSKEDIVFLISHSGETDEILHLLPSLKIIGCKLIGITGKENSTLARECNLIQIIKVEREACSLNLAPTSSTTASLVYGDALAVVASVDSGFGESDFGLYHPAGTLGKRVLIKVKDIMAKGADIPSVRSGVKITDAIMEMSKKELGVIAIVDLDNKLVGILTDGDLRRAIESRADLYGEVVDKIMTTNPRWIQENTLIVDALQKLKERRLNNFPVVDVHKRVIGMLTWQMIVREGIVL